MSQLSRRDFLKGAVVGAVGIAGMGVLGGCSTPAAADNNQAPAPAASTNNQAAAPAPAANDAPLTADNLNKTWSFEIAPEAITDINEEIEVDVVVVGAGTAGLITAVSAKKAGLDVALVTASSTPISRGGSNNAAYSKAMEKGGFQRYSPWQIEKEIAMNMNSVDQKKWYIHYNKSEEAMNWLIDIMAAHGLDVAIEHGAQVAEGNIYFTAPSAHGFINAENQSVGMTQPLVVNALADEFDAIGGKLYYKTIGRQLVRGGVANGKEGRVEGIICEREDGTYALFKGKKAVVLATGDFSLDKDMMAKYCPWMVPYIPAENFDKPVDYDAGFNINGLYKGDGQKMGLWVGAAWQKSFPNAVMGGVPSGCGPSPIIYDSFWGLMVDRNGERFMNEYASSKMSGRTMWLQEGEKCFAIWDKNHINVSKEWYPAQGAYGIMQPLTAEEVYQKWDSTYEKADTLEEIINKLGLPLEKTMATIERYNAMCEAGADTDFYKDPSKLIAIKEGPFYGTANGGVDMLTILGGLRTNANMQVCDADDNAIPGLYNVGTMVGDMYHGLYTFQMEGFNYGACCITFGYLLGKYIAENA